MDIAKFNIPRYLATQPMFSNMQPEELQRVARGCVLERIERGKVFPFSVLVQFFVQGMGWLGLPGLPVW